jgi:hypothetical protein
MDLMKCLVCGTGLDPVKRRARHVAGAVILAVVALASTLLAVFLLVTHAAHTNERADSSVWIAPGPTENVLDDGYVYREDPCVPALLGAMAQMQPFLPTSFEQADGLWETTLLLTDDGMRDFDEAHRTWEEVKVQCWRHYR